MPLTGWLLEKAGDLLWKRLRTTGLHIRRFVFSTLLLWFIICRLLEFSFVSIVMVLYSNNITLRHLERSEFLNRRTIFGAEPSWSMGGRYLERSSFYAWSNRLPKSWETFDLNKTTTYKSRSARKNIIFRVGIFLALISLCMHHFISFYLSKSLSLLLSLSSSDPLRMSVSLLCCQL